MTESVDQLTKLAAQAGRRIARQYPGVDAQDIAAAALADVAGRLDRLADRDASYLYRVLERAGALYAARERYDYMLGTSQYIYTPREVRALLAECYFDPAAWDVPTKDDTHTAGWVEAGTVGASLLDLQVAFERLTPEQQQTLTRRFLRQEDVPAKRVQRAVDAMTRHLNRLVARPRVAHEGPGARRAISNAQAQAITNHPRHNPYERDALREYQRIRESEPQHPAGTHFNW